MTNSAPNVLKLKEDLLKGGGAEKVEQQHTSGKKTARERISEILDKDTFVETDVFVKSRDNKFIADQAPCEGVVTGFGTVNSRPVYIYAQDYTVLSGSLSEMHAKKIVKIMNMAKASGVPVVAVIDSAGARIQEGVDALSGYASIFAKSAELSGVVPQIAVVAGPCIGASAIAASLCDVTIAVDKISTIGAFNGSVYDAKDGIDYKSDLTSAEFAGSVSGLAEVVCKDENEAYAQLKLLLDFLPSSNMEDAPEDAPADDINRNTPELDAYISNASYDVKQVISAVSDNGAFFEISADYAKSAVCGFMRINSRSVGVVANQPLVDQGVITGDAAKKMASFVSLCDSFNLPIVTMVDTVGLLCSSDAEKAGIVKDAAKIAFTYASATVPKVTLLLNKATGSAYSLMASKALGADMVYAWPSASIEILPAGTAAQIVYEDEIKASDDPKKARAEYTKKFTEYNSSPVAAAQRGYVDDIIDPINTRPILAAALEMLYSKYADMPAKKHGNMPL